MVEKKICRARLSERRKAIDRESSETVRSFGSASCWTCHGVRYYQAGETPKNLQLMRQIDELYTKCPFYGSRKMAPELGVNRKRVQRLMRLMGIEAIYRNGVPLVQAKDTRFTRICCETWRLCVPIKCGARTSRTYQCSMVFCIWWR
jgi:hypothetical protein